MAQNPQVPPPGRPVAPPVPAAHTARQSCGGLTALLGCLVVVLLIGLVLTITAFWFSGGGGAGIMSAGKPAVALIPIEGLITASGASSPFGFGGTEGMNSVVAQLRRAEEDDTVKAVVMWVDSPGGSPAGAQAVYNKVGQLKAKKPVVACMGDEAASGGYYVSCQATRIIAAPGTLTGSIGVIFSTLNFSQVMKKYGVESDTTVSGPYKDMMSPYRPQRPDERELIKAMIADIYDQFIHAVATGRNMPIEQVRKLADGRVYTGKQAQRLGLVDDLGTKEDAIKLAAKLGGIEGWPRIKGYVAGPSWLRLLAESSSLHRPWYVALAERPGPWLTLPPPGSGLLPFPAARP